MKQNFYIFFILFFLSPVYLISQQNNFFNRTENRSYIQEAQNIFNEIEAGISSGEVSVISRYFGQHTYFSLSNGKSGYFSSNQAYYVLEDFLNIYKVISFKFQNIQADENTPYATGVFTYEFKGKKNTSQVYISLKKTGDNWTITQITFN